MKNVSAAIIKKDNLVLITRRAPNEKLAGHWEFPGGKQERGETIQECLERELMEELNIETRCNLILTESIYEYDGGAIKLIAIKTEIISGSFELSVHDKYEWAPIKDLMKFNLAPADVPIAEWLMNE